MFYAQVLKLSEEAKYLTRSVFSNGEPSENQFIFYALETITVNPGEESEWLDTGITIDTNRKIALEPARFGFKTDLTAFTDHFKADIINSNAAFPFNQINAYNNCNPTESLKFKYFNSTDKAFTIKKGEPCATITFPVSAKDPIWDDFANGTRVTFDD